MSGIVRFFGSALPLHREGSDAAAGKNRQEGEAQAQAEAAPAADEAGEYGRSLLPPEAGGADHAARQPSSPPPATAPAAPAPAPALTYGEWSALRREALERYMGRRLLASPREEGSSPSSSQDTGAAGSSGSSSLLLSLASSPAGGSVSSGGSDDSSDGGSGNASGGGGDGDARKRSASPAAKAEATATATATTGRPDADTAAKDTANTTSQAQAQATTANNTSINAASQQAPAPAASNPTPVRQSGRSRKPSRRALGEALPSAGAALLAADTRGGTYLDDAYLERLVRECQQEQEQGRHGPATGQGGGGGLGGPANGDDADADDGSLFGDADDIPESDVFQVFEDDEDYHHLTLETQLQSQSQQQSQEQEESQMELPETQPDAQSQAPESQSQMETQPLEMPESQPATQPQEEDDDEEEEEEMEVLPDTQDQAAAASPMDVDAAPPASASAEQQQQQQQKMASSQKKKRKKKTKDRDRRRKIPHESDTRGTAHDVAAIDLRVNTVNLGLCRVVAAWPLRKTKRRDWQAAPVSAAADTATANANANANAGGTAPAPSLPAKTMGGLRMLSSPYGNFEDDGPLGNIYRSVLTLEVEEVVDEEREEALREQRRLFQRPFEAPTAGGGNDKDNGDDDTTREKEKDSSAADRAAVLAAKTRRRIRVFLYGKYAAKVSRLLSEWKYRQPNNRACALAGEGREEVLMSLSNVPARCVLPYYGRMSAEREAPVLLDNELGRCSRYCLCIGSSSHMMVTSDGAEEGEKERFDTVNSVGSASDLEMRIVMVRRAATVPNLGSPSRVEIEEAAARKHASGPVFKSTTESVLSVSAIERKESEGPGPNASDLAARYGEIIRKKEKRMQQLIDEARGDGSSNDQNDEAGGTQREEGGGGDDHGAQVGASGSKPEEGTAGGEEEQARKRRRTSVRYHTMTELQVFLDAIKAKRQDMQTGRRPYHRFDDSTNVYGIALSASAPYRTKRGDWMVNIHLIDESLPPTKLVNDSNENNSNADNTPGNPSARGGAIHVPSISMNIFSADKAKLPVIRYAGDVVRAHRVAVQEYNGEIQLVGRRNSSFYVVRPRNETQMLQNPQGQGWVESYTASKPSMLDVDDYMRMRDLWRWGRKRLIEHPTLHAKERFSIADVGPSDDGERAMAGVPIERTVNSGDIIAMVTAIIPQPPEQVSDRTPRAFLRLWDGTGRPESDPIPISGLIARQATQEGDPPASVLTAISKIVSTRVKGGSEGEAEDSESFDPPKCLCGRVVNVAIWEAEQWEQIRSNESGVRVGKFVRLKNVNDGRLGTENPKRCLMVHQKTSVVPIPDQTFEVNSILRAHNARILRKDPPNPSSGILPLTAAEGGNSGGDTGPADADVPPGETIGRGSSMAVVAEPPVAESVFQAPSASPDDFFTLAEVIGGPDETEPATFKSRFTVYGTIPEVDMGSGDGFKDLCVPADPDDEASDELAYEFSLSIRDDSAEINVIVLNDVAETFFMSVTASDVCKKGGTRGGRRRPPAFNQGMKDLKAILAKEAMWEGEICTAILENEKYFVLKSLTRLSPGVDC